MDQLEAIEKLKKKKKSHEKKKNSKWKPGSLSWAVLADCRLPLDRRIINLPLTSFLSIKNDSNLFTIFGRPKIAPHRRRCAEADEDEF